MSSSFRWSRWLALAATLAAAVQVRAQPGPSPVPDVQSASPYESPAPTSAEEPIPTPVEKSVFETTVEASPPTSAASAETLREGDLRLRPMSTPEDILRVVPGLVIAQHQGGGKADQLFLRGFDADHGTDVALFIDGVPINLPSHGHGQGFADLHFLIPEVIDRVDVSKGPYFAEYGDFDTAGAVNLRTRREFPENSLSATYGSFQTYRALGIATAGSGASAPWAAVDVSGTQGPFIHGEDLQRYSVFLKDSLVLSPSTQLVLLGTAYGSEWRSSGQIPARLVDSGQLDRFGALDPSEGGQTQRQMLVLALEHRPSRAVQASLTAYAVRYRVRLFSDFTFQLRDLKNFDEVEQNDQRFYTGLNARFRHRQQLGRVRLFTTLGAQARYDTTHVDLWHDVQRRRLGCFPETPEGEPPPVPCDDSDISQTNIAGYLEEDAWLLPWLRVIAGVRADLFEWNVTDLRPGATPQPPPGQPPTTGSVQKSIVNPKLRIVLTPTPIWDIYLDGGGGFHSNDARAVIAAGGSGSLPRAWGGEIGTRVRLLDGRLDLAAAGWILQLQSEQVFSADQATTESAGATRRYGLDLEARWQILRWMWVDADLSLAHARYRENTGNGNAVALAPTFTGQAGLNVVHPSGLRGRLGVRFIGDRPATENPNGLVAEGYTLLDLTVAWRWRFVEVGLTIENLLDARWREAQFATTSLVAIAPYRETSPHSDVSFTPGNPLSVRATVGLYF
jgi:outer membrane receptor protein involved in Fe transport